MAKFIPQDPIQMKNRQEHLRKIYKTETALAEAMVKEMKPHHGKAWIDQPGVNRILNGKEAVTTLELLVLSKIFQTTIEDLLKPELRLYCINNKTNSPKLRKHQTANESDDYLAQLESEGRILAFSEFPSLLFSTDEHPKRKAQVMQPAYENIEYYTVDAYLNFLFSIVSSFALNERISILEQYTQYFCRQQGNVKRRIAFFSRHHFNTISKFSSLELFPKKNILIMRAPTLQQAEGDVFLEINDDYLCTEVEDFYTNQIETIRNPLNLLDIGKATLVSRLDGMSMEDSVVWFYQKCRKIMEFSTDPDVIYQNFNPEVQAMLDEVKTRTCE